MRLFKAPDGFELAGADCSAVEPRICAHMSQDRTMLSVYGKEANPAADIYLTTGAKLSIFKDKVLQYYNPDNPTKEGVKLAKLHCDKERKRSKTVFLAFQYGMREGTLSARENIPLPEAEQIIRDMARAYSGIVAWNKDLKMQWARNGGYLINGRGVPMCVDREALKDCGSRVCQSTGVMLLRRIVQHHLRDILLERKIETRPVVPNYHDEFLMASRPEARKDVILSIDEAFSRLNYELNWSVDIKHGGINFGQSFEDVRCE